MAVGTGRLDLCVEFRGARYAIEVKTSANFQGEKSKDKTWDEKIYSRDEIVGGKTIHVIGL